MSRPLQDLKLVISVIRVIRGKKPWPFAVAVATSRRSLSLREPLSLWVSLRQSSGQAVWNCRSSGNNVGLKSVISRIFVLTYAGGMR